MRLAESRSTSGGMVSSWAATMYHEGLERQAADEIVSLKHLTAIGPCVRKRWRLHLVEDPARSAFGRLAA
jgi:hypothetical protein